MKTSTTKSGYIKVSDSFMLDELLTEDIQSKLLLVHICELLRIKLRNDRTKYISKAERSYVIELYEKVILNKYNFKPVAKVLVIKKPKHIGLQMYHFFNSININKQ